MTPTQPADITMEIDEIDAFLADLHDGAPVIGLAAPAMPRDVEATEIERLLAMRAALIGLADKDVAEARG